MSYKPDGRRRLLGREVRPDHRSVRPPLGLAQFVREVPRDEIERAARALFGGL
jgi:hypothetical protein